MLLDRQAEVSLLNQLSYKRVVTHGHHSLWLRSIVFNNKQVALGCAGIIRPPTAELIRIKLRRNKPFALIHIPTTSSQIEDDNVAHVKVPFGLINDINDISDIGLQIAIPYQREHSETGELYNTLHHVNGDFFALRSYHMDSDVINQKEEFADMEDQFDDLIENGVANVWRKKQLLVKRLRTENFHNERTEILYTCLNTCIGLADGNIELIEEFTDIEDAGQIGSDEAQKIYSNLTVEEFFDWSTEHFGLDDYYTDTEVLVDNVKYHMEDDESMLEFNEPYKFITKMIARTFPIIEHN